MDTSRALKLNDNAFDGASVVYVMSRDQRLRDNHALLAAQAEACKRQVPLLITFNLKNIPSRAREHYEFMLDGLEQVASDCALLNIPFIMRSGDAYTNITEVLRATNAGSVYFDFTPLTSGRALAKKIAHTFHGSAYVIDTHNIVPVWTASNKQEFAAHTMRRKIHHKLEHYLVEPPAPIKHPYASSSPQPSLSFTQARQYVTAIPSRRITIDTPSGEKAAARHLAAFIALRLDNYALKRNDIADDQQSGLSPYLHFGQISSLRVALDIYKHVGQQPLLFKEPRLASAGDQPSRYDGMNALFEEMIVRKELADNFCFYQPDYTSLRGGPDWAQQSIAHHRSDPRTHIYTRVQWENAETHDQSWNAAQNQLRKTGKIHGYMRMYWAKKMLEWSKDPETALVDCIYLNDAYSIDGGDPNGYVGILWSIVGLHDRPWQERPVFGKVRYMNEGGLMRKYDVLAYQRKWNRS